MNIQYLIFANTIIIFVYLYFTRTYKTKIIIDKRIVLPINYFLKINYFDTHFYIN